MTESGDLTVALTVVNFTHPLHHAHLHAIERLADMPIGRVLEVPAHFDPQQSFVHQARQLVDRVGLSRQDWQTVPLVVNLPALNVIAALVLAELHGRCGFFPAVLDLRPDPRSPVPSFRLVEILDLQQVRSTARGRRTSPD